MKTQKFTLLQLFSILDGRLSTKMDDVYVILNHILDDNLMTHHLPVAMKFLEKVNPLWLNSIRVELHKIKTAYGNDFETLIKVIKKDNTIFDIPQLTAKEKEGFGDYMVDNSLLLKRFKQ